LFIDYHHDNYNNNIIITIHYNNAYNRLIKSRFDLGASNSGALAGAADPRTTTTTTTTQQNTNIAVSL
jgi:hypothetical protein